MARIRSVKPDLRRSLTAAEWPREVRLAWIYLWCYLDDAGRGIDDMRLIVADLFPLDRDVTERKMDGWLAVMASSKSSGGDVPPLCRYEVAGRRYLHATKWHHQKINRPQPSRIPPCPMHERLTDGSVNGSVNDSRNGSVNGSLPSRAPADQGSGSREQGVPNGTTASVVRPRAPDTAENAAAVIAAFVEAACESGRTRPTERSRGQVGRDAKALLAEGVPLAEVVAAAKTLAGTPHSDLRRQVDMARTSKRSTVDDRVSGALALADELRAAGR